MRSIHMRTTAYAAVTTLLLGIVLVVEQSAQAGPEAEVAPKPPTATALAGHAGSFSTRNGPAAHESASPLVPAGVDHLVDAPRRRGRPAPERAVSGLISPEGWLVARGSTAPHGAGRPVRYTVEVEAATGLAVNSVAETVTRVLTDPRGWHSTGRVQLQRIDDPTAADVRIVVAMPDTVDGACRNAGLNTAGWLSCYVAGRVMLNVDRWRSAVPSYEGQLTLYRAYVVNHEVGHALGLDHVDCPGRGLPAPVMMQQSKSLDGCLANGWVDPDAHSG